MTKRVLALSPLLLLGTVAAATAHPTAGNPQEFMLMAVQGDDAEIVLGQLAQRKGGSDQVRNLGETIANDRATARQQALAVDKTLNVTPPTGPPPGGERRTRQAVRPVGRRLRPRGSDPRHRRPPEGHCALPGRGARRQRARGPARGPATAGVAAPPAARPVGPHADAGAATSATAANFLKQEHADTWRASKVIGVPIYGPNNAKVGDVNDVLMDYDSRAAGLVIGIGGVLGPG